MNNFIDSRPQRLCLMCGRCCRMSTTPLPYEEMKRLAEEGNEGAIDFLDIFEPHESIEEARKLDGAIVDNILNCIDESNHKDVTFYHCKFIQDNNYCGNYENRRNLCRNFPSTAWAVAPPGCGYEGWLFQKQEEIKQKVRKWKESIVELKAELNNENTPEIREKINLVIEKTQKLIDSYAKYGSADW